MELVDRQREHRGRRPDAGAVGLEIRERGKVDQLVLEREHVAAAGQRRQCVGVATVALEQRGACPDGRFTGGPQAEQLQIERDRRLPAHPCELAGSHDPDSRRMLVESSPGDASGERADGSGLGTLE